MAAAVRVLEEAPLRTFGALHLASALVAAPAAFVSAARVQLAAARTLGINALGV